MRVAVLSCGPSVLESYRDDGSHGVVVAVNWCGELYRHDWLCVMDSVVIERGRVLKPRLGMVAGTGVRMPWPDLELRPLIGFQGLRGWAGNPSCGFTFPKALLWSLAAYPDAFVDVYGFDASEDPNVGGEGWNHGQSRWRREIPYVRFLAREFVGRIRFVGCGAAGLLGLE